MNLKKIAATAIGLSMALGTAVPAFAASISYPLFSNGQTTIDATGGSTVSGTFTLTVGQNETVEWLRSQADTQPFSDTSIGDSLGKQEGVYPGIPFTVKVPPNTGTYNATEQGAGIFGGNRAINGGDNVVFGPTNLGTIRVTATGGTNTSNPTSFEAQLAALTALVEALIKGPLGNTPDAVCSQLAQYSYLHYGMSGATGLQNFLIGNGQGGTITYGATGYFGMQTQTALNNFNTAHHCK